MPTYEYACKKCGETFEVVQSFTDEPLKKHKGCGGTVKKVFGNVGISFKGSGFYKNDSRPSGSGSSSSSSSSTDSSSSTSTSSETKSTDSSAKATS